MHQHQGPDAANMRAQIATLTLVPRRSVLIADKDPCPRRFGILFPPAVSTMPAAEKGPAPFKIQEVEVGFAVEVEGSVVSALSL